MSNSTDLILDFNGGTVQAAQGYDIPDNNFDGFTFTGFTAFDQSNGLAGDLNSQIEQIVAGVREDFAFFDVNIIWDNAGVNSFYFDNQDTVVMIVGNSGTEVGIGNYFGIAANVDVPSFTGDSSLQSRRDTAFAFLPPHVNVEAGNAFNEIRELIDTISHEAGHTFGLSHTNQRDNESRQIVTTAGQNRDLDSRFSSEELNHGAPETAIVYSEVDRLNETVGAASTLPEDQQSGTDLPHSSQTLPNDPHTPLLGSVGSSDFLIGSGGVDFLGDRDAFRFEVQEYGEYTILQDADDASLDPVITLWDEEGDFVEVGTGDVSAITLPLYAGTYYAIAGSQSDQQGSGSLPIAQTGSYTLLVSTPGDIIDTNGEHRLRGTDDPDQMFGLAGDDRMRGRDGDDEMFGGSGNDRMRGDDDNDTLVGGLGNDILFGNSGSDVFVLIPGDGTDTIRDFDLSEGDKIGLGGGLQFNQLSVTSDQILFGTEVLAEVSGLNSPLEQSDFVSYSI